MTRWVHLLLLVFVLFSAAASAQNGAIRGTVHDDTKYPLVGVSVAIKGSYMATLTDLEGNFAISNIKPGAYTVVVSYFSYKPQELKVEILPGKTATLNVVLAEDVAELAAVEVQASRVTYSETAVLLEIKEAKQVVSGVSSQEISRSPDKDAAQVASRVPGVTIVDNSFVMIRGLSQRYNNVMLNGITAPSTEPDSRAFAFDLIPSSVMDRMLIFKSGTADMPGDFAGGVIKIFTKTAPGKNFTELSLGTGYRVGTTFATRAVNRAGSLDFLGFDRGRALPRSFPSNLNDATNAQLLSAGQSLTNNFGLRNEFTPVDFKLGFSTGRNFRIKDRQVSALTSVNYAQSQQFMEVQRNRWTADRAAMFDYQDEQMETEVRLGVVSNFSMRASDRSTYTWRNTFNQIGERSTIVRRGTEPQQRLNDEYLNYSFQYLSRSIFTSQLEGQHTSDSKRSKLTWINGLSYVNRNEPDFRRIRSTRPIGETGAFTIIDPPGATTFDNARFFSRLHEVAVSNSTSWERRLGDLERKEGPVVKAGGYLDYRYRDFKARWMSYVYPGFGDPEYKQYLVQLPIDQVFSPEHLALVNGWRLVEGTNPSDIYTASTGLGAAYVGIELPFATRYNLSAGLRAEYFNQRLNSATQTALVRVNNTYITPMPFANLSYAATPKAMLRMAYSRTVNRPELRELAPFLYYNFKYDVNYVGDPNLVQADVHNLDARWEFYPQSKEVLSVGVFYKRFNNPIETYVQTVGLSQQFKMGNARSAENLGVEVEVRKSLGDIAAQSVLSRFFLVANATYLYSEVDLGREGNLAQEQIRALQGQSPYVVNAGLHYRDDARHWSVSALYNVAGARIFFVGNDQFPTVYEMPRNMLDLVASIRLTERTELKLGASNLLDARTLLVQDTDRNGRIDYRHGSAQSVQQDDLIMHFRRGIAASASLTFKL